MLKRNVLAPLAVVLVAWVGISSLHFFYHFYLRPPLHRKITVPPVPSPYLLKALSMGNPGAVAMGVWLRVLPYVGDVVMSKQMNALDWEFLAKAVKAVLDLDEYFYDGYLFATCFFDTNPQYIDVSIELGERGTKILSQMWDIPFFTAMNYILYKGDRENAARLFEIAASRPKAPSYVYAIAGGYFYKKGEYHKLIRYYRNAIKEGLVFPAIKEALLQELKEAENLALLQDGVVQFKEQFGRPPESLQELVDKGIISHIPRSPFKNVRYYIDKEEEVVKSTYSGFKIRLWQAEKK